MRPQEDRARLAARRDREYELANNIYDFTWEHRCDVCDAPCMSRHGVLIHKAIVHDAGKWDNTNQVHVYRSQLFKWPVQEESN